MAPKRKAPEELSTNLHTVKSRNRKQQMSEVELQIEKAKKADASAVRYTTIKLRGTMEYKNSDEAEQAGMRVACGEKVLHKRYIYNLQLEVSIYSNLYGNHLIGRSTVSIIPALLQNLDLVSMVGRMPNGMMAIQHGRTLVMTVMTTLRVRRHVGEPMILKMERRSQSWRSYHMEALWSELTPRYATSLPTLKESYSNASLTLDHHEH
jgi:hypothetical protein